MLSYYKGLGTISCPSGYTPYAGSETDLANKPLTDAQKQGYACMNSNGMYLNQMSDPTIANLSASYDQSHIIGYLGFVAAGGALMFLPGWGKLLAIPLAIFGVAKQITGGF